jgi:hypothetical protein
MCKAFACCRAGTTFALLTQLLSMEAALAIPIQSNDLVPAPAGTAGVMTYYLYNSNGDVDTPEEVAEIANAKLLSQYLLLRPYYYFSINGMPAAVTAVLQWGKLNESEPNETESAAGDGPTILSTAFWLINKPEQQRYLAIAPYLWLPNGQYNSYNPLNVGENRWKGALQLGLHQGLGEFSFEFCGDVTLFADNPNYGLAHDRISTNPSYELQVWLRHDYSKEFHYEAGFTQWLGGDESINGTKDGFRTQRSRVRIEAGFQIAPKIGILVEGARDVSVQGGFKADFVNMVRLNVGF